MSIQLTARQRDILTELINVGMGKAAGVLNRMVGAHVLLQVPFIEILNGEELGTRFSTHRELSRVRMGFKGAFSGSALLIFPMESASHVVDVLMGEQPTEPDLDMIRVGALSEVGNIILNSVIGSLSNMLEQQITYTIPTYLESDIEAVIRQSVDPHPVVIVACTKLKIEKFHIEGHIVLLFQVEILDNLLSIVDNLPGTK